MKRSAHAAATILMLSFLLVTAFSQSLQQGLKLKLHPAFRTIVDSDVPTTGMKINGRGPSGITKTGEPLFDAIITTTDANAVRSSGVHVNSVVGKFATALVTPQDLFRLVQLQEVEYIDPGSQNYLHLDNSLSETGANLLHSGFLNNTPYKGKNVIVLIYDSGIDWRHLDFRESTDTTRSRILAIWDQTLSPITGEAPPTGFSYGVEYTKTQINDEIDGTPRGLVREKAANGHGTHVAGIAAGNGNASSGKYVGVAPEADIVVVKGGEGSFSESKMIDGLTYAQRVATTYGKPVVVNWSLGGQAGPHDGTSAYEVAVNSFVNTPGRVVVVSAGNDGDSPIHRSGSFSAPTTSAMNFEVPAYTETPGSGNDSFSFDLWLDGTQQVTATLTSPTGLSVSCTPTNIYSVSTNNSDGYVVIQNSISNLNGKREIWCKVADTYGNGPKTGTWTLTLSVPDGLVTYDGWLTEYEIGTTSVTLQGADVSKTVGMPGTAEGAITVASYVTKIQWPTASGGVGGANASLGDLSTFSSIGPTRDGRQKPDIAAPGEKIISALSSDVSIGYSSTDLVPGMKYWGMQGTSMAAPQVTGAVALLLNISSNQTASQIKSVLTSTGSKHNAPNISWGYGKLDVLQAAMKILNPLGTIARTTYGADVAGTSYAFTPYLTGSTKYAYRFSPATSFYITGAQVSVTTPNNNPIVGNGQLVCELFTDTPGSTGGVPGTRIGSPVYWPLSLLSAATNNFIDLSQSGWTVSGMSKYHIVLSMSDPLDRVIVRQDDGAYPMSSASVYINGRWVNIIDPSSGIQPCNLRIRVVATRLTNPAPSVPSIVEPALNAVVAIANPNLKWNEVSGATSYNLQVSTNSTFTPLLLSQTGIVGVSYGLTSLAAHATYYWRVSASNAGGSSQFSLPWSFTTNVAAPSAPILVFPLNNATAIATTTTLMWNTTFGATTYRLQVSTSSSFATTVVDDSTIADTTKLVGPLQRDSNYYWRISAKNVGGNGLWSVSRSFTTVNRARGDIDGNTVVQAADASYVLMYVVGISTGPVDFTNPDVLHAADANASGMVSALDASWILQASAGLITLPTASVTRAALGKGAAVVTTGLLSWSSADPTEDPVVVKLRLKLSDAANVYSAQLTTKVDMGLASIDGFSATLPDDWQMKWNVIGNKLRIAMAGATPLPSGDLGLLTVRLKDKERRLSLETDAMLNEYFQALGAVEIAAVPTVFALQQNYPNPFNPSTTISYAVPKSAIVSLRIFNSLGQEVALLVNEEKTPGYHQATWNATASSGIYFYRLQAGEYVETKKMIVLR